VIISSSINESLVFALVSLWRQDKFEDNTGIIRRFKSKDRQYSGQKKKNKQYLQNTENKLKDWATQHPHKFRDDIRCSW
jgi:hypothetical protein